ncbi:asparagine synthetase B family protein, partial [Acidobacteriota bacterium]
MCGICGIVGGHPEKEREASVRRAMKMLEHRGPDGQGLVSLGDATLGHTRLSIIDLRPEAGQPMFNEREDTLLVFNGEIYNHLELRDNLQEHAFRSRMDGEVILHLYEDKGKDLVDSLLGMFAFAVWDSKGQRLLLARDRFGQKPLYYHASGDTFAFASEIPALLYLIGHIPDLRSTAIYEYLHFQYIHGPHTVFEGIEQLPPSHVLA